MRKFDAALLLLSLVILSQAPIALGVNPNNPSNPPNPDAARTAQLLFDRARVLKARGFPEEARAYSLRAIKLDPKGVGPKAQAFIRCEIPRYPVSSEARLMNVKAFNLMSTPSEAIPAFQQCIKKYPKFEYLYGNLALVYLMTKQTAKAKLTLHEALQINPYYANAWMYLAQAHMIDGKLDEARKCILHIKQIDPYYPAIEPALQQLDEKEKQSTKTIAK
jgi:hypothetical protein